MRRDSSPPLLEAQCKEDGADDTTFDVTDWGGTGDCTSFSDQRDYPSIGITSYLNLIEGYTSGGNTSDDPGAGANNVSGSRTSGPCPMTGTTRSRNGPAGAWSTSNTDDVTVCLGDSTTSCANPSSSQCTSCNYTSTTSCSGIYSVRINPTSVDCIEFDPVRHVISGSSVRSRRRHSTADDCTAGSGRFALVHLEALDHDGDSLRRVEYTPFQVSGTGTMTNAAWVTELDLVDTNGATLRVAKPDVPFSWSAADELVDASQVSLALSSTNDFSAGTVSGNPPILTSEIDVDDVWGMEVDMTWTCGTAQTASLPQGWIIPLEDIGCDMEQKLTLRYATSPSRVIIEPYGNPNLARVTPTTTTSEGQAFSVDLGSLSLDATLTSWSSQSAVLDIATIRYNGNDYCTAGTYTLAPE